MNEQSVVFQVNSETVKQNTLQLYKGVQPARYGHRNRHNNVLLLLMVMMVVQQW